MSWHTSQPVDSNSSERQHRLGDLEIASQENWINPFYFIQAADTQFGLIDDYIKRLPNPGWEEELALSKQLVKRVNQMEPKPKFLVICGDLVDAFPGTPNRAPQVHDLKEVFSELDRMVPIVCVCGNHDIGNEPNQEGLEEYWRDFGQDYFYFVVGGVLFIVLNSQFYQHRAHLEAYAAKQDAWLERILERCKDYKYSIVFEHIPWFLHDPDEEKDYFSIEKDIRLKWLKKFSQAGVNKIMCGHYHRNAGGWYDEKLELIVTSAVGGQLGPVDKSGARLVRLLSDRIDHRYYALEEIPTDVPL